MLKYTTLVQSISFQHETSCFEDIRQRAAQLLNGGETEKRTVEVQQWNLVDTLMQLHSDLQDIDVTEQHLRLDFIDEMDSDFGGVSRLSGRNAPRCFSKAMICHLCPDVAVLPPKRTLQLERYSTNVSY
jgi:hypothetical protein